MSRTILKGQYAFLLQGTDEPGVVTTIGSFAADGTGHITAGEMDDSHSSGGASIGDGAIASASSYAVGPDHRGCLFLATTNGAYRYFRFALGSMNSSSVATKGHIIEFDQIGGTQTSGTLRLQDPASFSASQLKGTFVFGMQGATGRVTFNGASAPPVILYLYWQNQGILLGTDTSLQAPAFGFLEPQAAGPFTNASFSGAYMLGMEIPTANLQITACNCWDLTFSSGVLTADGAGNASGTSDQVGPNGVAADQSQKFTYTISADGSGNVGSGTTAILIFGNKLVFLNNTTANPIITVVEK